MDAPSQRLPLSLDLVRNLAHSALAVRLRRAPRVRPVALAYFSTFRCNMRCRYCEYVSDGFAERYPEADTAQAKEILRLCRQGTPAVGFSGGEPLLRDDIVELVAWARQLGYRPISLMTNSLRLPQREEVLDHIDYLQISLDTLDAAKQDRINGREGVGERVQANVARYARLQARRGFRLSINCVVGPDNLDDVPALMDFAVAHGVRFTLCPQLDDRGMPDPALLEGPLNARYVAVMKAVVRRKDAGDPVLDIRPFLEHLTRLQPARCYPALTPRVYPDGSLVHPCPTLCREPTNVLASRTWPQAAARAERRHGSASPCAEPCLLPCYQETSLLVRHPLSLLSGPRG